MLRIDCSVFGMYGCSDDIDLFWFDMCGLVFLKESWVVLFLFGVFWVLEVFGYYGCFVVLVLCCYFFC